MALTKAELNQMDLKLQIDNTAEQFERTERLLRDYANKMKQVAHRIRNEQPTKFYSRSDVANSGINDIENCLRNINFAQIARYAARLEIAEHNNAE